jgi:hypothetical protein
MLDRDSGVVVEKTLKHEGEAVREFYASIPPPVVVGIEATGSMGWFLRWMEVASGIPWQMLGERHRRDAGTGIERRVSTPTTAATERRLPPPTLWLLRGGSSVS